MKAQKKYCYQITASGYGTRKYCYDTEEECLKEMREDADCLAAEMEGEVQPYDDKELTVYGPDGDEIARFEALFESSEIHPKLTCDRCGFTSRQEDYFDIVGDEILCDRCRRKLIKEKGKKFCYMMSASGYGTRKYCFDTEEECREEMMKDAEVTAAECDGEVQPYDDDELVVCSEYDGEVARFEYIG